jgi:hypothetical protein
MQVSQRHLRFALFLVLMKYLYDTPGLVSRKVEVSAAQSWSSSLLSTNYLCGEWLKLAGE